MTNELVNQLRSHRTGSPGYTYNLILAAAEEIERLQAALDEQAATFEQRVRAACMKVGLELGREEMLDRKGEPLPTAREIMDKAAASRTVNADGSRVETKPNRWKVSAILRIGATANKTLTPSAFLIDRYGPSRVATQEHSRSHVYNTEYRANEVASDLNRAGWEAVVIPLYQAPLRQDGTDGSWAGD